MISLWKRVLKEVESWKEKDGIEKEGLKFILGRETNMVLQSTNVAEELEVEAVDIDQPGCSGCFKKYADNEGVDELIKDLYALAQFGYEEAHEVGITGGTSGPENKEYHRIWRYHLFAKVPNEKVKH